MCTRLSDEYLLDNRAEDAQERFGALAALFNTATFRHMEALGIGAGWRCWEVGAGGRSVPDWLAHRVGPDGRVIATDLDATWVDGDGDAAYETLQLQHDVASDDPPDGDFHLVHARLVLVHVPDREEALRRMTGSLRPGGWLLIEDFDTALQPFACIEPLGEAGLRANKIRNGFRDLLAQRGVDLEYGRKLPRLLREAGFKDVGADAYFPVALGAGPRLEHSNVSQVRDGLVGQGLATDEEVDAHLASVDSGELDISTPPLVSAWGRLP